MSTALINPSIVRWARERLHLSADTLASKIHVKEEKLLLWEEGTAKPTFKQAQDLARILHIPFGYFFLPTPPVEILAVPDLRTVGDRIPGEFTVDLREVLSDVLRKQDWYREYLREEGADPLPFIGKFSIHSNVQEIAADVTATLRLSLNDRDEVHTWEEFLKLLMDRAEDVGIWILRTGKVGSNTHRILDVADFRGFAICDSIAPVVFINGTDAKAAQIFTIVHELVHLWLGKSGVSDYSIEPPSHPVQDRIEKLCNDVAAEVLVPRQMFRTRWQRTLTVVENADALARYFRVSTIVIARRALDCRMITRADFFEFYQQQVKVWRREKEDRVGSGDFYRVLPIANGRRFTEAVLQSVYSQNLLMRDGARLLGITPRSLGQLALRGGLL
jgi:Zn-dependent peptidase ImmA (M78 family)/DNA-binding XRE family transcriptional regulator